MQKIKNLLESKWLILPVFFIALIFQITELYNLNVLLMATVLSAVLFFCEDVKNIFGIFFFAPFYIDDIYDTANWYVYGVAIGLAVVSFIYFIIKQVIKNKKSDEKIKKSRLFIPLALSTFAFSIGGVFSNFMLLPFLITLGISLAVLFFVYVTTNHTKEMFEYLPFLFVMGGVFICLEMLIENLQYFNTILYIFIRPEGDYTVGAQNINATAIYIMLGMVACFWIGQKRKNAFVYLILASVFAFIIITTSCRMVIALSILSFFVLMLYTLYKTRYKKSYTITILVIVICSTVGVILGINFIKEIIEGIVDKINGADFYNGRKELWSWCFDRFLSHPIFGYGFITPEFDPVPSINAKHFILAHNTLLQWLVSLGVFGTIIMLFYAFSKYKILFESIKTYGIYPFVSALLVALSGLTDQAAQMDTFIYVLSIVIVVSVDNNLPLKTLFNVKRKKDNEALYE